MMTVRQCGILYPRKRRLGDPTLLLLLLLLLEKKV